ncbi:DUF4492 domain-containing protein [Campylobacter sp. 2018MI35]|uniref:DUF4492 domain-containing protein n=1 Tax=Campylobacter sp. 2018MI34 TaxID=2800582 RepID=UPI0019053F06|nr:DUF4492 domain-containing protein [Campylobacter sp. 2018MI34]MBK1991564.1 DUF4492 domain-containing protein [Campylobacter sp. 2018MI34]
MFFKYFYSILIKIFCFYKDGFKSLTLGKTLWKIIFVKLFIIFIIFKIFLFDINFNSIFKSFEEKSDFVFKNLLKEN